MNVSNSFQYNPYSSSVQTKTSVNEDSSHPQGCDCPNCNCDDVSKTSIDSSNGSSVKDGSENENSEESSSGIKKLSTAEEVQVSELQARDTEVRAHEAAHIAAGGSAVTGGASFSYQKGPDGKQYAVGGEVPISIGGSTPQERIDSAQAAQAGALAPSNPSPQDLKVASSAARIEAQARQELAEENSQEVKDRAKNAYEENSTNSSIDGDTKSTSNTNDGRSKINISA